MTGSQAKELIAVRKSLGMDDKRANWKECELCDNADFQPGTVCSVPNQAAPSSSSSKLDPEAEKLVQALTDQILAGLSKKPVKASETQKSKFLNHQSSSNHRLRVGRLIPWRER